jgi:glycosyltransferase involved in cell wall biosynthesis
MVKVSIVIPVYNTGKYLYQCIDSVLCQTLCDIEVICVDDGSIDNSLDILKSYVQHDKRLIVLEQIHSGVSTARNVGLNFAHGKYIRFLDSDDWYPSCTMLQDMYDAIEKSGALICGGSVINYVNGLFKTEFNHPYYKHYVIKQEKMIQFSEYQFDACHCRYMFMTSFLRDNSLYYPLYSMYEDPIFTLRAMICAKEFYGIPTVTYCHRIGHKNGNWTSQNAIDLLSSMIEILKITNENKLAKLHYFTVLRIEDNFSQRIVYSLKTGTKGLLILLLKANILINAEMMRIYDSQFCDDHVLLPIEKYLREQELINKTSGISELFTYISRKYRGFIRCINENGIWYTIQRIKEKMRLFLCQK